jgi:Fic family protein
MDSESFHNSPAGHLIWVTAIGTGGGYWAFAPNPLPPPIEWTPDLVSTLSDADRALGELAGLGRSLPNPHLLIRPFVHWEAVLSSRIEGTRASLSDLYAYEAAQPVRDHQNPSDSNGLPTSAEIPTDVREVANYVRALEYGLERMATLPLSLRLIREMHGHLMPGVRGEGQAPGEFRTSQNWIGPPGCTLERATYVPPPPGEMTEALNTLDQFLHAPSQLPPLLRLGLIHYQFESIHPFLDGNGRSGRLLVTLLLCAWDLLPAPLLYLSAFFEAQRAEYYDCLLEVSRTGAWERWLVFFLRGVAEQARDAVGRARRLQALRERYRGELQSRRMAARLLQLVDLLFAQPVVTARQVEAALGVDFPTALRYVNQLVEARVLRETTGKARKRVYRADEILQAIEAPLVDSDP